MKIRTTLDAEAEHLPFNFEKGDHPGRDQKNKHQMPHIHSITRILLVFAVGLCHSLFFRGRCLKLNGIPGPERKWADRTRGFSNCLFFFCCQKRPLHCRFCVLHPQFHCQLLLMCVPIDLNDGQHEKLCVTDINSHVCSEFLVAMRIDHRFCEKQAGS